MGIAAFSGNSNYKIDVDAYMISQNAAENYSVIYWRIMVRSNGAGGYWATLNTGNSGWASAREGTLWNNGNFAYDFRGGSVWTVADGQFRVYHRADGNAEFNVYGGLDLVNLGHADSSSGWVSLPSLRQAAPAPPSTRVPNAPTPNLIDQITQTSMRYIFSANGDGGSPVLEWQAGYGFDPNTPVWFESSPGYNTAYNLKPGTPYYFWSRGRNANGWGPWSSRMSARTLAGSRIKMGGAWKEAVPYVKVNGVWRIAQPYVKTGGSWRKST